MLDDPTRAALRRAAWVYPALLVVLVTGAVASHALARAALHDGNKPILADKEGKLAARECADVMPDLAARVARPLVSEQVGGSVAEGQEGASSNS